MHDFAPVSRAPRGKGPRTRKAAVRLAKRQREGRSMVAELARADRDDKKALAQLIHFEKGALRSEQR